MPIKTTKKVPKTAKAKKTTAKKAAPKEISVKKAPKKKVGVSHAGTARKTKETQIMPVKSEAKPARKRKMDTTEDMQKLRIRVMAYEHKILDSSVRQIMDVALRYDAKMKGPIPLPTEIKKYTVNRSSFIHKDAREQFEMRIHKRFIDLLNPRPQVIEALTNLTLPSGVVLM